MSVTDEKTAGSKTEKLRGQALVAKVKELIHQGNVRRIRVKNDQGHTVMEIPVTAGVVAAVAAPVLAAVGAIAALTNDWTIEVDHKMPVASPAAAATPVPASAESR